MTTTPTAPLTPEQRTAANALGGISHHEAAHAVAALHLGAQVLKIRMWQVGPTRWYGNVDMRFPDTAEGNRTAAVALLIGIPTELRWLDLHHVPTAAYPHDIEASSAHDRDTARECLRRIPRPQRPSFREVERQAVLVVDRCWDRIEHLAHRLAQPHQPTP